MGFQVYNSQGQELQNLTGSAGGDLTGTYPNPTLVNRRLDYQTRTTNYTVSATSVGSAADLFSTDVSFTADGSSTYIVEVLPGIAWNAGTAGYNVYLSLVKGDGTEIVAMSQAQGNVRSPLALFRYQYVPAAGTTTLNVRAFKEAGGSDGTIELASGSGRTAAGQAYIAVYKL